MSLVLFEVGEEEEATAVMFGKELNLNEEAVSCQSSA